MSSESPTPAPLPGNPPSEAPQPRPGEIVLEQQFSQILAGPIDPANATVFQAVAQKLTREHVGQLLELLAAREQNAHAEAIERHRNRPVLLAGLAIAFMLFVLLLAWLALSYGKSEIVLPVLTGVGGVVAGALGGYGYGYGRSQTGPTGDKSRPNG